MLFFLYCFIQVAVNIYSPPRMKSSTNCIDFQVLRKILLKVPSLNQLKAFSAVHTPAGLRLENCGDVNWVGDRCLHLPLEWSATLPSPPLAVRARRAVTWRWSCHLASVSFWLLLLFIPASFSSHLPCMSGIWGKSRKKAISFWGLESRFNS